MLPLLAAPRQVPSLRFAPGLPQGRRRAFGCHKSHPQAPPCVLRAGNRLLHPLKAHRNFAVGTALCGNMRPYELGVSKPQRAPRLAALMFTFLFLPIGAACTALPSALAHPLSPTEGWDFFLRHFHEWEGGGGQRRME